VCAVLIYLLAFVNIAAHVGEFGLHLGVGQLHERFRPKEFFGGFEAQVR
jgi:hypothetical protein